MLFSSYMPYVSFFILYGIFGMGFSWGASSAPAQLREVKAVHRGLSQWQIALRSQPSTGYRWSVLPYSQEYFLLSHQGFDAGRAQNRRIGAKGTEKWSLQLKPAFFQSSHQTPVCIQWVYARPWEKKQAAASSYELCFVVKQ